MLGETFNALAKEAQFTREILGAGATQIRRANYASKGIYFQAFTSLSTGLERIGKLTLMLDHYIHTAGQFPDPAYLKEKICHKISLLYTSALTVVATRAISLPFLQTLDDPIHQGIIRVLSEFAEGDRYSNINLLLGAKYHRDPVASWAAAVDLPIFEARISARRKATIAHNARVAETLMGGFSLVRHTSESGTSITSVEDASFRTGMYEAVAPYRQLYVLQVIRFWAELLGQLQDRAMEVGKQEIPFFNEIFAPFCNPDSYIRTRRTWDRF